MSEKWEYIGFSPTPALATPHLASCLSLVLCTPKAQQTRLPSCRTLGNEIVVKEC